MIQVCLIVAIISLSVEVWTILANIKKNKEIESDKERLQKDRAKLESDIAAFKAERNIRDTIQQMSDRQLSESTFIALSELEKNEKNIIQNNQNRGAY